MTRHRTLSRRLRAIEAALAALTAAPAPNVLCVGMGETRDEALARFNSRYPVRRNGLLIVAAKPTNDAEHATFAARFKASQLAIVRAVKRSYSDAADETPIANPIDAAPRISKTASKTRPWTPGVR